jgi:hypothetical protein
VLAQAGEKLRLRNGLPGAHAFDRAAAALASASARGVMAIELLPLVFASSWFVNNAAPSTVYRKWLTPPLIDVWMELGKLLEAGAHGWLSLTDEERTLIQNGIRALALDGHRAGAVSKPLALLAPDAVPLMPDAAVWFALDAVARPEAPDAQTASIDVFSPMMTWFAESVTSAGTESSLAAIAREHESATGLSLSAAQILDRILWFDSVGHRHFRTAKGAWWCVDDDERHGIVWVAADIEGAPLQSTTAIDLAREDLASAWKDAARSALEAGL